MLSGVINYLKNPMLVAKVQEYFGIDVHEKAYLTKLQIKNDDYTSRKVMKRNGYTTHESVTNGCTSKSNFTCDENISNETILAEDENQLNTKANSLPVNNYFWYYLFLFSTHLGDEIFYCTFIPFWFWNIDDAVGRKTVLVWTIVMATGQMLKDIIRWPRPSCPPAVRLQKKWSLEYGMPSTHASVAVSIPFGILFFTMNKYVYSIPLALTFATIWCLTICLSRIYLGMHTILDIIAGLLLAFGLTIPLVPAVNFVDYYFSTNHWALGILIAINIAAVVYYPCSDKWTPTREDTAMVVALAAGVYFGTWCNYQMGSITPILYPPPYSIVWPSYSTLGCMILRTIIGFACVLPTKSICKYLTYEIICAIIQVNSKELMNSENSLTNKRKTFVNLLYKFIFCFIFGIHCVCTVPRIFHILGIHRSEFYTEL